MRRVDIRHNSSRGWSFDALSGCRTSSAKSHGQDCNGCIHEACSPPCFHVFGDARAKQTCHLESCCAALKFEPVRPGISWLVSGPASGFPILPGARRQRQQTNRFITLLRCAAFRFHRCPPRKAIADGGARIASEVPLKSGISRFPSWSRTPPSKTNPVCAAPAVTPCRSALWL